MSTASLARDDIAIGVVAYFSERFTQILTRSLATFCGSLPVTIIDNNPVGKRESALLRQRCARLGYEYWNPFPGGSHSVGADFLIHRFRYTRKRYAILLHADTCVLSTALVEETMAPFLDDSVSVVNVSNTASSCYSLWHLRDYDSTAPFITEDQSYEMFQFLQSELQKRKTVVEEIASRHILHAHAGSALEEGSLRAAQLLDAKTHPDFGPDYLAQLHLDNERFFSHAQVRAFDQAGWDGL